MVDLEGFAINSGVVVADHEVYAVNREVAMVDREEDLLSLFVQDHCTSIL